MASTSKVLLAICLIFFVVVSTANAQLSTTYYVYSCPNLESIVRSVMIQYANSYGASILRLFFHDCFVNGCDASVLLDDTPTLIGEKYANPNNKSLRGFYVIDIIKAEVEKACSAIVSCADILALAARDSVFLLGGPSWNVTLGRRDSRTASFEEANNTLPSTRANLSTLISQFKSKGFDAKDLTALAGAHTIGKAHCRRFRSHIYNDTNIDPTFAALRKRRCPYVGGDYNLARLDIVNYKRFDNGYFKNLVEHKGLLGSDQVLYNNGSQDSLVKKYSVDQGAFFNDFVTAIIKMGNLSPLNGHNSGEIRLNCRKTN